MNGGRPMEGLSGPGRYRTLSDGDTNNTWRVRSQGMKDQSALAHARRRAHPTHHLLLLHELSLLATLV